MIIQEMKKEHTDEVFQMMKVFYSSPAVSTNGSDEIFMSDIQNCINDNPFLEGYVFAEQEKIMGYAMAAKSFSTEFGKPCVWIEDIYIKPDYRGKGIGSQFLDYIEQKYRDSILRLEVEEDNTAAVHVYKKNGFDVLPYMEMKK
ncbi:MAG: GNAT family N-acetyltransferase [Oscillospiraceae bacterium]|nr:GNAT family N-acetyltransferase [Oscillospiraceae bacterium]